MNQKQDIPLAAPSVRSFRGVVSGLVYLFENVMPDPFTLAIWLTLLVGAAAYCWAPHGGVLTILSSWYDGTFKIVGFALQMILIFASGYAISDSPLAQKGLRALAATASTPTRAALLVVPLVAIASWFNWGVGLVGGALLAREIAKRTRVDFAWLVAACYSGCAIVTNSGLSSSIALSQASHGNALNLVEKATGQLVPLSHTVFAPFVYIPTIVVTAVVTAIFIAIHPKPDRMVCFPKSADTESDTGAAREPASRASSFGARLDRSILGTAILVLFGASYLAIDWSTNGFNLGINTMILVFMLIGLVLQRTPIAYAESIRRAAGQTGAMLLQFPLYGGIMGIMTGTGLASVISSGFLLIATSATLPLWSYLSSLVITLFIPSSGGHWAVQGPFVIPAALSLHADIARTSMGVALAENVSVLLQPFWVVPVVAIAGIRIQPVMAYTSIAFLVSLVVYAVALAPVF
ncbi:TIGR00366 family protein [Paraburkholderia silviterrae]|uniref:Short-chain fatty acid transporter n=1 Tax=Paraburkholderia silviterrae TaxID=2528715 RepID=A0A4R5M1J0_9BURK|nr:TIGR00366 family protein [Paraburkholderia silviterrae]TDG19141.1 short-chain fatty acid transporter [Paraburkholderia silviterrae]